MSSFGDLLLVGTKRTVDLPLPVAPMTLSYQMETRASAMAMVKNTMKHQRDGYFWGFRNWDFHDWDFHNWDFRILPKMRQFRSLSLTSVFGKPYLHGASQPGRLPDLK